MNKKDFMDWFRSIIIITLVAALVIGVIAGLLHAINISVKKACKRLGDQIGYNTRRISSHCLIEIRPNV